jgi:hypothetical protein
MIGIVVPYRDRERYLPIFLRETSLYLLVHHPELDYWFFIAEQVTGRVFSAAVARNIGAAAAIDHGCDYLVFMDVDTIPVRHVDWTPPPQDHAEIWFQHSGGVRMSTDIFLASNGYNLNFWGWGEEDTDFCHRLKTMGNWVTTGWREKMDYVARNKAMVCNLEFEYTGTIEQQKEKARIHANHWWNGPHTVGHRGPWFMSWEILQHERGLDPQPLIRHSKDGWRDQHLIDKNQAYWKWLYKGMEPEMYIQHAKQHGFKQTMDTIEKHPPYDDDLDGIRFTRCLFKGKQD